MIHYLLNHHFFATISILDDKKIILELYLLKGNRERTYTDFLTVIKAD